MNKNIGHYQNDVREFHARLDQPIGSGFNHEGRLLRDRLITEETEETIDAIVNSDMLQAIDGLCDSLYVSVGAAVSFGFYLIEFLPPCLCEPSSVATPSFGRGREDVIHALSGASRLVNLALSNDHPLEVVIPAIVGHVATVFAAASRFHLPLSPFWDEVHRSNLAKGGGPIRGDGKRLKPVGWTPPDLGRVYLEMYGRVAS